MEAKHILLKTPLLVEPILQAINQGADFAQLAREHSACPSGSNGGDWGKLDQSVLPQSILEALNEANIGDVIGPLESRHGLHLIKLEGL
ncbi:peptidylprolyl isomerase [Bermanella sp. WJH001]|uniref:peptidylprolyl isomerase n=1 Tax=Bermanella sp. WJH001 TaxID=3048005 RepID=UPI0024BE2C55|nr:peptidylprolyl isomerase [Bermanella sp. WJH001]MDJ1538355.1 peptidylprolyl isomerase [Bermanella sp. WJH001]